jgi:hypothetical protein
MGHHKEHASPHTVDYKVGKKDESHQKESPPPKSAGDSEGAEEAKSTEGLDFNALQAQQERLMKRLHELQAASTDAWAELKTGAEHAFEELKGSVQKIIMRFESALHQENRPEK